MLARSNRVRVRLIEQARFPRDKVCGECLSALGIGVLRDVGLTDAAERALRPVELTRTLLHPGGDLPAVEVALPAPMWGVSRAALDTFLLRSCVHAGVVVHQPARVEHIEPNDHSNQRLAQAVTARDLATGRHFRVAADVVILADGKSALSTGRPHATGDMGIKSHWLGVDGPVDAIELFGLDGHYGGVAPVEGGRCNLSFSVPAAMLRRFEGDIDQMFNQMTMQNRALRQRLRGARRAGRWHAAPLPRFAVRDPWPAGVVPVGNAAAAIEPIGGEGMGLAMRSAQLAAEAILDAGDATEFDVQALRQAYRGLWDTRRRACRALAQLLSRPAVADAAAALVEGAPHVGQWAMRLAGK